MPLRWPVARHPAARGNARGRRRRAGSARNPFEEMPSTVDEDYMQNLIFEGGAPAAGGAAGAGYHPNETQSQDGRGAFTPSTFD